MWSLFFKKSKQLKVLKKGETNKAIIINNYKVARLTLELRLMELAELRTVGLWEQSQIHREMLTVCFYTLLQNVLSSYNYNKQRFEQGRTSDHERKYHKRSIFFFELSWLNRCQLRFFF